MPTFKDPPIDSIQLDFPFERILDEVKSFLKTKNDVIVIGYDRKGNLHVVSSFKRYGDVAWLLEKSKTAVIKDAKKDENPGVLKIKVFRRAPPIS